MKSVPPSLHLIVKTIFRGYITPAHIGFHNTNGIDGVVVEGLIEKAIFGVKVALNAADVNVRDPKDVVSFRW